MTHWLTPDGYNVMLRGLMGDAIKFTRIKYGNGTPGDGANDLKNPLLSLKIASATRSEKYVTLSVSFKNVELEITGFWATEIGIYVDFYSRPCGRGDSNFPQVRHEVLRQIAER